MNARRLRLPLAIAVLPCSPLPTTAQVEAWDGYGQAQAAPAVVILPAQDATPPIELRQTADRRSGSVSAAHEVPPGATALRPLLEARGWRRLAALLEVCGGELYPWRGVWYAEHARAQLAPGSLCCSEPAWVAWTCWRPQAAAAVAAAREAGEQEEGGGDAGASWVVHVCAVDGSAARRALVALEVARGAAVAVELAAWPRAWWSQLERCAEEGGRQLSEGNAMAAEAAPAAESAAAAMVAAAAVVAAAAEAAAAVEDAERAAAQGSESGSGARWVVEGGAARRRRRSWVDDLPNATSPVSPLASAGEVWARLARPSEAARGPLAAAR